MSINTNPVWDAGMTYDVEVNTNAEQTTLYIGITDKENEVIYPYKQIMPVSDGNYIFEVKVPSNEKDNVYVIDAILSDGVNNFTRMEYIQVRKMSWYRSILNRILNLFGISL